MTAYRDMLSLTSLHIVPTTRDATHVVTDILYRAEVYFVFNRRLSQGEDQEKSQSSCSEAAMDEHQEHAVTNF